MVRIHEPRRKHISMEEHVPAKYMTKIEMNNLKARSSDLREPLSATLPSSMTQLDNLMSEHLRKPYYDIVEE